jgi:hypothetical protein
MLLREFESPQYTTVIEFGDKLYAKLVVYGKEPSDLEADPVIRKTLPTTKQLSAPSGAKSENVGNLFWLGGDLIWTAHGLTQSHHHISELGLADSAPAKQLFVLKSETSSLPESALDRDWRSAFSEKIYEVTRMINGILGGQQPRFRPNPQS